MPLPVIPDVFRVTLNWEAPNGLIAATVLHFGAPTLTDADVWAAIDAHFFAGMWDALSPDASITSVDIIALDGTSGTQTFGPPTNNIGNGAGQALAQVCALVKSSTGLRGPAHRGRSFLPFVGETDVDAGKLIAGADSGTTTAWEAMRTAMGGAGCAPVVASYAHSSAAIVTSYLCETVTATQKRRQNRLR